MRERLIMTKKWRVALVVAVLFAVCCMGLSAVFVPKNNSKECGMIYPEANGFLGEPKDSIDVVFLGDSEVFSVFSPLQIWHEQGLTSYDVSTPGQTLWYAKTLLKRVFTTHHPRVVVFETDSLFLGFSLAEALFGEVQDVVPLFEYHSRWKSLTLADFTTLPQATWTDSLKGFKIDANIQEADVANYDATPTDDIFELRFVDKLWMRMMVDMCRDNGAIPLFVSSPSPATWSMARHNAAQALADELSVEFVDLNLIHDELGIDWETDSSDGGHHVNLRGAQKVSRYMGTYLAVTFELEDRRDDPAYASWNEAYEGYPKQVEQALSASESSAGA